MSEFKTRMPATEMMGAMSEIRRDAFDLRRLATLLEVARLGSFSAAADSLNFTQSAISQQIAAIERQAGVALLNRSPVSLTRAGQLLCDRATAAISQMQAAELELGRLKGLRDGFLRLGSFASAGVALMPRAILEFQLRHPAVKVSVRQCEVLESEELLKTGDLDLALTFEYSRAPLPPDQMIERALLVTEPVFVGMRADSPLNAERDLRLQDLVSAPWIDAPDAGLPLTHLAEYEDSPPLAPCVSFAGDDLTTVLAMIDAGIGIALLPGLAFDPRWDVIPKRIAGAELIRSVFVSTLRTGLPAPVVLGMEAPLANSARHFRQLWKDADQ